MNWKSLLSTERFGQHTQSERSDEDIRSEFQRDYDRIVFSSPFRRLQNKTQVFPLPGSVFVHNRLTHSLEVASVGRSLGNMVYKKIQDRLKSDEKKLVREIDTVVAAACLAHDLGNPPFGHSGEKAISHFFADGDGKKIKDLISAVEYEDLVSFEGNANLLRLLTHQFKGRRRGGYALTYASLGTMIKYPYDSSQSGKKKKFGYFQTEKETFAGIMSVLQIPVVDNEKGIYARHPLVYLVEAADDICYQIMDLEDAQKLDILGFDTVKQLFLNFFTGDYDRESKIAQTLTEVTDPNEQIAFLRAMVISKLVNAAAEVFSQNYESILDGRFDNKILKLIDPTSALSMKEIEEIAFHKVYKHPSVVKIEISGYNILGALLKEFYHAIINPSEDYAQKILSMIPAQYHPDENQPYILARAVTDFISGMTDVYAVDLYKQIRGLELRYGV
ncbi:MAG: deoxyguanosinetriphosphate triphosphohydrolase [Bacteroidetes bacterium]|nr:MAG: deoxyguanosinetriphosphate triphosphohydrolase [Bacteroidota bacterium]